MKKRLVVLASGSGSNFQALVDAATAGHLEAEIICLISNKAGIGALEKAKIAGIDAEVIEYNDPNAEKMLFDKLKIHDPDLIILAGWLKKIPLKVIRSFPNRILNIHPALLPDFGGKGFYGIKVHQAVIDAGKKVSGCTVHIVAEEYDEGPIIAQTIVPVLPDDTAETLAARVLAEEHLLYPSIIQQKLSKKIN